MVVSVVVAAVAFADVAVTVASFAATAFAAADEPDLALLLLA